MTDEIKTPSILLSALDNYGGNPFDEVFDVVIPAYGPDDVETAHSLSDRVALILWGGSDISPTIYGQEPARRCGAGKELSHRDKLEVALFNKSRELSIPVIGICRGAQLACALSGGTLVQHANGHGGGWHKIRTSEGTELNCPSLHHQMMNPWDKKGKALFEFEKLAWMEAPLSSEYLGPPEEEGESEKLHLPYEPEVLWIPHTKSLCIQSHPEFIHSSEHPFIVYCLKLVQEKILNVD